MLYSVALHFNTNHEISVLATLPFSFAIANLNHKVNQQTIKTHHHPCFLRLSIKSKFCDFAGVLYWSETQNSKTETKKICNVLFWYPKVKVPLMINHLGQPEKGWIYSSEKRIQGSLRNGNRENELQKTGLGK